MPGHLLDPVRPIFRALAEAFVPDAASLDARGWEELERIAAEAIAARPPAMQRQVLFFVRVLNGLSLLRHLRPLHRLDRTRRTRLLEAVGRSPVLLLRRGVWGLRTLAMMGYYARPDGQAAVGYRAHPSGWEART